MSGDGECELVGAETYLKKVWNTSPSSLGTDGIRLASFRSSSNQKFRGSLPFTRHRRVESGAEGVVSV
jgi:hypothetical protein